MHVLHTGRPFGYLLSSQLEVQYLPSTYVMYIHANKQPFDASPNIPSLWKFTQSLNLLVVACGYFIWLVDRKGLTCPVADPVLPLHSTSTAAIKLSQLQVPTITPAQRIVSSP